MSATLDLAAVFRDLEVDGLPLLEASAAETVDAAALAAAAPDGQLLVVLPGRVDEPALAALRDRTWPGWHISAFYQVGADGVAVRTAMSGRATVDGRVPGGPATLVFARDRERAMGMDNTRAKFDLNAEGWNGEPGSPTYGHFRWMRKLLADVAGPVTGLRTLDAGCGAGWVGIEAALRGAMASAFDPSPAMVEIAKRNAAEVGVDLDARVGFVEEVPFEHDFELVLNSGVISFAPDADVYLDRLDALVAPGGLLVIGDANPTSAGFARRRRRPILPARELNALRRADVEARLRERGYTVEGRWYYQLTFPVPEAMAASEQRLGGLGCGLALLANKLGTALDHTVGSSFERRFDSWILRARKA